MSCSCGSNGFSGLKSFLIFQETRTSALQEEERAYEQGCGWSQARIILRSFNHNLTECEKLNMQFMASRGVCVFMSTI